MFGGRPPVVIGPAGLALRDVMERGVVGWVLDGPRHAADDVASRALDLMDSVILTASTDLLTDEGIEAALGRLPWALQDRRAMRF